LEPYQVDVGAKQIVRWLMDEERHHAFDLLVSATRSYEREELEAAEEGKLGEAEDEPVPTEDEEIDLPTFYEEAADRVFPK